MIVIGINLLILLSIIILIIIGKIINKNKIVNIGKMILVVFIFIIICWILCCGEEPPNQNTIQENNNINNNTDVDQQRNTKKTTNKIIAKIINIQDNYIYLNNNFGIKIESKTFFENARTKKQMNSSDLSIGDYILLYEGEIKEDTDIIPKEKINIIRNITGENLRKELLKSFNVSAEEYKITNGEYCGVKELGQETYLVELSFSDYYTEITGNNEKFYLEVLLNSQTNISNIYSNRLQNIKHAQGNMLTIVLDKKTINNKNPLCLVYEVYDG